MKKTRKLTKTSSKSYNVVLPKEIVVKYGWKEKQKLLIQDKGKGTIQIKDWRNKKAK